MPLLAENDRDAIKKHFSAMNRRVAVTLNHSPEGPGQTGEILQELAELTDLLDLSMSPSEGTGSPVISVGPHGRVLFWGTPSGYEFNTLLTAILDAGRGEQRLSPATIEFLDRLTEDLDVMVFVTPACPHCPGAAVLAHRMAAASPRVSARVVEAQEHPDLARANRVMGVPRTVVNGRFHAEGNMAEPMLIPALSRAMASGGTGDYIDLSEYMN
jgi:alkyl hydroperoxide reductase subunit AhpF